MVPTLQTKKLRLRWVSAQSTGRGRGGAGICTQLCLTLSLRCVFPKAKASVIRVVRHGVFSLLTPASSLTKLGECRPMEETQARKNHNGQRLLI